MLLLLLLFSSLLLTEGGKSKGGGGGDNKDTIIIITTGPGVHVAELGGTGPAAFVPGGYGNANSVIQNIRGYGGGPSFRPQISPIITEVNGRGNSNSNKGNAGGAGTRKEFIPTYSSLQYLYEEYNKMMSLMANQDDNYGEGTHGVPDTFNGYDEEFHPHTFQNQHYDHGEGNHGEGYFSHNSGEMHDFDHNNHDQQFYGNHGHDSNAPGYYNNHHQQGLHEDLRSHSSGGFPTYHLGFSNNPDFVRPQQAYYGYGDTHYQPRREYNYRPAHLSGDFGPSSYYGNFVNFGPQPRNFNVKGEGYATAFGYGSNSRICTTLLLMDDYGPLSQAISQNSKLVNDCFLRR